MVKSVFPFATRHSLLATCYSLPLPDPPICRLHDLPTCSVEGSLLR
ncbi:MAG: hypothetical protein ACO2PL_19750 [Armatimonadota bacterium]